MKKLFTAALVLLIPLLLISPSARAVFIDDSENGATTYYGGTTVGIGGVGGVFTNLSQDVIGLSGFDVAGMEVTRSGGIVTVVITGNYINNPTTGMGDLYISTTGWHTSDAGPHHATDKFLGNEGWNYIVPFSDPNLYHMAAFPTGITGSLFVPVTQTTPTNSDGRINQALRGGQLPGAVSAASVALVTGPNGTLTFIFQDPDPSAAALAFHWTMDCGNDVIEGEVTTTTTTPEPGTMLLAGCGLIALAAFRRKFKK